MARLWVDQQYITDSNLLSRNWLSTFIREHLPFNSTIKQTEFYKLQSALVDSIAVYLLLQFRPFKLVKFSTLLIG